MGNTKIQRIFLFSFVFLILSFSLVSAAPPVLSTVNTGTIDILAPQIVSLKQYEAHDFYWHVFNSTKLISNVSVSCDFHLYDNRHNSGEHIFVESKPKYTATRDFEAAANKYNFSNLGKYSYLIECNSSSQAGGIEGEFYVTPTGEESRIGFYIFLFILAFGLMTFGIFSRDIPSTILGGFALTIIGLYCLNNGIDIYRNFATEWISILTIVFGGFWAAKASLEGYLGGW